MKYFNDIINYFILRIVATLLILISNRMNIINKLNT